MSPEALARLREKRDRCDKFRASSIDVEANDLRALLDAYDEAMKAGQTVVECADEMRQQWAEIEEKLTEERDTARAEGVAAERARVVADLRRQAKECRPWARGMASILEAQADRYGRGEHDKEGEQ